MGKAIILLAGAVVLVPVSLTAQAGPEGPRHQPEAARDVRRGDLGGMAYHPHMLLRRSADLQLSDDQVTRLEALASEVRAVRDETRSAVEEHSQALRAAWRAENPDPAAIEAHTRALLEARSAVELAGAGAAARAKLALTTEQRGVVRGLSMGRAPQDTGRALRHRSRGMRRRR